MQNTLPASVHENLYRFHYTISKSRPPYSCHLVTSSSLTARTHLAASPLAFHAQVMGIMSVDMNDHALPVLTLAHMSRVHMQTPHQLRFRAIHQCINARLLALLMAFDIFRVTKL